MDLPEVIDTRTDEEIKDQEGENIVEVKPPTKPDEIFVKSKKPSPSLEVKKVSIKEEKEEITPPKEDRDRSNAPNPNKNDAVAFDKPKEEKPKRKKRVMSEKQLEALRIGRERSLATRKARAEEKNKKKAEINRLKTAKLDHTLNKLKNENIIIEEEKKPAPVKTTETKKYYQVSEDELKNISSKAINDYEVLRKARKAKKKEKEEEEKQIEEIQQQVRRYSHTYSLF